VHDVNISPMPNVLYLDGVLVPDQKVPDAFWIWCSQYWIAAKEDENNWTTRDVIALVEVWQNESSFFVSLDGDNSHLFDLLHGSRFCIGASVLCIVLVTTVWLHPSFIICWWLFPHEKRQV
jgi:hypothetical protein